LQSADVQPIHPSLSVTDAGSSAPPTPAIDPARARRRRPRGAGPRRSWRRRLAWWIPLGLLMAVAVAGGGTAWRVRETFQTLNSASTAAPSLSGDVLGGDRGVVIDTGPAKTAVAAAASGATRTPTPTGPTSTWTAPAAVAPSDDAPTSTATPERPESTSTTASTTAPAAETPAATDVPAPSATETPADAPDPTATQEPDPTATEVPATGQATAAAAPSTSVEGTALDPTATEAEPTGTDDPAPTATRVPLTTATAAPEPEATAPPASEATATPAPDAVALSAAAETPERVLSEVERIADGGFEEASAEWYAENAWPVQVPDAHGGAWVMELPATGAYVGQSIYFIPGTTYQLTGWVRMTAEGHAGEFGVFFWDEAEQRIPPPSRRPSG
jgi:hypothetical protein